jgi:hypothetical protein
MGKGRGGGRGEKCGLICCLEEGMAPFLHLIMSWKEIEALGLKVSGGE